ncbi:unnamed protein product [Ectocarpus sp. CCAP 1310/34]|nr:unnamed protein product [Ectocarpus sp. CCAP 1310/34]
MTTVTPLMLALFGGSLQVHHERQAITVDSWLHFRAARRAATLVKYLRVHMERLLLRKITHPQEDVSDNGRDLIQARRNTNTRVATCAEDKANESRQPISMPNYIFPRHDPNPHPSIPVCDDIGGFNLPRSVSTLLRSGARRAGAQQDYSTEMLAAEINGVRQGGGGVDGWGGGSGGGYGRQQQQQQQQQQQHGRQGQHEQTTALETDQKQLRVMQRREQEDAVRRSAVPAGGHASFNRSSNGGGNGYSGGGGASRSRDTTGGGVSEEELFAPLRSGLPSTDTPVRIPTATARPSAGSSTGGAGGGRGDRYRDDNDGQGGWGRRGGGGGSGRGRGGGRGGRGGGGRNGGRGGGRRGGRH